VVKNLNKGAVACVCLDNSDMYLGASTTVYDSITSSDVLEAMRCSEALSLGGDLLPFGLLVVSDCLNIIKSINGAGERCQHCMLIREVQSKRMSFLEATFSHERRESNGVRHIA
jgi:hypothetical protein